MASVRWLVETSGVLCVIYISILFASSTSDSFISPFLMERCGLVVARQNDI